MKAKFRKLAKLVDVRNAYKWMREAGKIGDDFFADLSFAELEEIFGSDGRELSETEKNVIAGFMAEKAVKAKEYAKTSLLYSKLGKQEKAQNFLDKAQKTATLEDWVWMFRKYEISAIGDKAYLEICETAKKKIMKEILG